MSRIQNPNCSGGNCLSEQGEVRVYPLGGGANLILCRSCFAHENAYRAARAANPEGSADWPIVRWETAEVYA